jgi:hypothetical protein
MSGSCDEGLSQANSLVNERLTKRLSSVSGHVIVRVSPGGGVYRVVVTDNSDELDRVVEVFGRYESMSNVAISGLPAATALIGSRRQPYEPDRA